MKFCFVGVGSIATKHINALKKLFPSISIHAFRTGHSKFISSVQTLIDKEIYNFNDLDKFYDAVYICNPTNLHYDSLVKFKDKSDYFFVEKPVFDKNYTEKDLAVFNGKNIYVACPLRYHPVLLRAKEIIKEKGNPISARIICSSYLPEWRPSIDYRTNYSAHKDMGGGVSIDLIHEIDYMTYFFGFPIKDHYISGTFSTLEIDSDDLSVHLFEYPNMIVEMHLDYFGRKNQRYLEMFFNDEFIKCDILENKVYRYSKNNTIEEFDEIDKYLCETQNFVNFIHNKNYISNDLITAVKNLKLAKGELFYE
ncbi:MAG: Gfo/Idh/MocA family oxidoreductase [Clostridia bacterium]|nr:Gfo/Idh/MocA family oxidoreductase [Clostridia bacterium]